MKFWNLRNEAGSARLYIYGDIEATVFWGDEITPATLKDELDACEGPLDVYINSGGGDVFAGQAIYNMIKHYAGQVTVHIDGLAASIATVIAMAGDRIVMPENALMMIHNAWCVARGNSGDLRDMADQLDRVDGLIRDVYAARTGIDAEVIASMMAAETWFTAAEALEAGLVDEIEANKAIAASLDGDTLTINGETFDLRRYAHAPRDAVQVENEPDNGGESEPVEDTNPALEDQRKNFQALRRKILETTN